MVSHFSCVRLSATLWPVARRAPMSMGFSRQECWRGLPCPPPGDLSNPGIEPASLTSPALAGGFFTTTPPGKPLLVEVQCLFSYLGWSLQNPYWMGFPGGSVGKESTWNVGDLGSIPGLGRWPGEGNSYPLQYSGLEKSMDFIVHGATKSQTWLSDFHTHTSVFFHSE